MAASTAALGAPSAAWVLGVSSARNQGLERSSMDNRSGGRILPER
jgi:hypothetical protein